MSHPNKRKGDRFEIAVRDHCRGAGFDADRTRAGYARDRGDIHLAATAAGPQVIVQCKNTARLDLASFLRDVADQRTDAGARHGFAVVKRRGVGDVGRSYAVMELDDLLVLLEEAGYMPQDRIEEGTS